MRSLTACALALALSTSSVLAAETAPLAPGKPAGVKQAVLGVDPVYFLFLAVAVGVIVGISSSGGTTATTGGSSGSSGGSSGSTGTTG